MSDRPIDDAAATRAFKEHTLIIGMVAVAWNGAQEALYVLFVVLMGMRRAEAEAIFFTLKADSAQRDITLALAKVVLADNANLMKRVTASIRALIDLAGERNAAMHTMWHASLEDARFNPSPNVKHHGSLRPDHRDQFLELTNKLSALENEIFRLARESKQHLASRDKSLK